MAQTQEILLLKNIYYITIKNICLAKEQNKAKQNIFPYGKV